jgi:hypothetical protein
VAQLVLWLQRCGAVAQLASVWMRTGGVARDGFNVVIAMMIKISINSEEEGLSISPVYFGGITGFQEEAPVTSIRPPIRPSMVQRMPPVATDARSQSQSQSQQRKLMHARRSWREISLPPSLIL